MKKVFRELRVPVCGRFYPNEGGVAGYGNRMRVKYTAKWGLQIAEMIFQTRSSILFYSIRRFFMTHNIIYTPRKTSLSETGSRSLTSELSVQRPEGASYGGSQTWFSSPSIRGDGCGLIAAHDLLWYLERKESLTAQTDRHRSGE